MCVTSAWTSTAGTQENISKGQSRTPQTTTLAPPTLQKACTAAQFEANPAGCPPASAIGRANAITPILPVPLEGPAYFVSHGGEGWPSLVLVLQGDGVTIDLTGTTLIHKGVTSSTFKTVPDQPVTSFELTLPEGPDSALAALGNLCTTKKLTMPTELIAQNARRSSRTPRSPSPAARRAGTRPGRRRRTSAEGQAEGQKGRAPREVGRAPPRTWARVNFATARRVLRRAGTACAPTSGGWGL
jgi:hypothetical protein